MKYGVVIFPGSNCDRDTLYAIEHGMGDTVVPLWHKDRTLPSDLDCIILPGGFSYGDYLRPGAIARFSPIMHEVKRFADRGGYVLGICNGFQILTEAQLLPGALLQNASLRFICRSVFLRVETTNSPFTAAAASGQVLRIPIAHAEGRYYIDPDGLKALEDGDQILFRYATSEGEITEAANPNGSLNNIAGIVNRSRNVCGMMPHPERAVEALLGSEDGKVVFESLRLFVQQQEYQQWELLASQN